MDRARTVLTLRTRGAVHEFRSPDFTGNYPNDGAWTGRVVFAGFGITAPELKYDDYAGIDAKGKIVLIFNHEPQEDDPDSIFNGKGNTRYANARAKMMIAQRHGAAAVLMSRTRITKRAINAEASMPPDLVPRLCAHRARSKPSTARTPFRFSM